MPKKKQGKRGAREGTIFEMPGGNAWRGAVSLGFENGKRVRKWIRRKTRGEVVDAIEELKRKKKLNLPTTSPRRTVEQFMDEWLTIHVKPNKAPLTFRGYEQTTRMHIVPILGRLQLDKLNGKDVQKCLNKAAESGLSPTSVKNINATLKSALSTGKKWQYIDRNAAKDATPPKQVKFRGRALAADEGDRLFAAVKGHRYEAIFYLALMMGLRRGETAGLSWRDIDLSKGRLDIQRSLQRIAGKGLVLSGVKTEDSAANVSIPRLCIDALLRRQIIQEKERLAAGAKWKQDGDFVFTSRYGSRIVLEELTRELDKALIRAELPHVRFHDLRHSTASLLLSKGIPMKVVQEIMRHSNFQITMDTYSHLLPSALNGAMETMNDVFSKPVVAPVVAPSRRETIQ